MTKLAAVDTNETQTNEVAPVKAKKAKRQAHFLMQPKGGVGKSLVATLISQYFTDNDAEFKCMDTDTSNATLTSYAALNAQHIPILNDDNEIDTSKFDVMLERLMTETGTFVIDNGSNSYVPLLSYMLEIDAFQALKDEGVEVFLHTIVVGGDAVIETLNTFRDISLRVGDKNVILWINEYFGPVEYNGRKLQDMPVFAECKPNLRGVCVLHKRNHDTYLKDMRTMATKKQTFAQVMADPSYVIGSKMRLKTIRKDTFDQIAAIGF